jgi:hypothetical protein
VHGDAGVAMLGGVGLAGVETHADGKWNFIRPWTLGECPLSGDCGLDRASCMAEGDGEGIALRIDLDAPVLRERGTKHIAMRGENCAVSVQQPLD